MDSLTASATSGFVGRDGIAGQHVVPGEARVIDIEVILPGEARWKRESQQPALTLEQHAVRDIQEGGVEQDSAVGDSHPPVLLHDEEATAIVARMGNGDRAAESVDNSG